LVQYIKIALFQEGTGYLTITSALLELLPHV